VTNLEIVVGSPGTGKTTYLLNELRTELERGVPPDRIGFVTFTRRAAQEAQTRVLADFGLTLSDVPNFRTLHSLCMRYCGMNSGTILQGGKIREFSQWIGEKISGRHSVDGQWAGYDRGDRLMFMVNLARIRRVPLRELYEQDHDELDWLTVERFDRGLRVYKAENGLHDFSDMLEQFVATSAGPRLEVLLVDEAQDLSLLQWDAVRKLSAGCRRTIVAGDDQQAIFVWAGADVDTLIDLEGRETILGQSYRVPRRIQVISQRIISRVRRQRRHGWSPRDEDGVVRWLPRVEQAEFVGESTMILARNRHQLTPVEDTLRAAGILYEREGTPSVSRADLEAIVAYERLRRGERVTAAEAARAYDLMSSGVGVRRGFKKLPGFHPDELVGIGDLRERGGLLRDEVWHIALDRLSEEDRAYLIRCRRNGERLTREPRVKLSTIHGSKGGEANRVVLLTDMAPRTWRESHQDPDSEARVWYVACTRAKEELCVVAPTTPRSYPL